MTIVVPVYGAVQYTRECIQSVFDHVDLEVHRLLVVNDLGPEADAIESMVTSLIKGKKGVQYERNSENLGFVGTCNRAVNELDTSDRDVLILNSDAAFTEGALDAMIDVLYASEKHGVVCARSNDATIASIPLRQRDPADPRDADSARKIFDAISSELPAWTLSPVAVGFCFLVRRTLARNHGMFDPAFSPGYDEENDFCLRVNALGMSAAIANHAFVSHASTASFDLNDQKEYQRLHGQELERRYPYYHNAVSNHLRFGRDVVDNFAAVLAREPKTRPSILIDLHHMSLHYDGSIRNALSFLELLQERAPKLEADFTIQASSEGVKFFNLAKFGFTVLENGVDDRVYDAAFALSPIAHTGAILSLNRKALRWMVSHLDVIALRSLQLRSYEWSRRQVVHDSLRYADRVVSISEFTTVDTRAYFPDLVLEKPKLLDIPEGLSIQRFESKPGDIELRDLARSTRDVLASGDYILVMGNGFPHKQVVPALTALAPLNRPLISLGLRSTYNIAPGVIHEMPTGSLSDELMDHIIEHSALMVFPSSYEGFGLPLAEAAAHGKRLLVFRSAALEETVRVLGIAKSVTFFDYFDELAGLVEQDLAKPALTPPSSMRTIRDYNNDIIDELMLLVNEPVDMVNLRERWNHFMAVGEYMDALAREKEHLLALLQRTLARKSVRAAEWIARKLSPLRPFARKMRNFLRRLLKRG